MAEPSHLALVLDRSVTAGRIDPQPATFSLQKGLLSLSRNTLQFVRIMRRYSGRESNILVLSCNNSLLVPLKLAAFMLGRRATIMLHGFIDELNQPRDSRGYRLVRFTLTWLSGTKNFRYVVISGHIIDAIADELPRFAERVYLLTVPMHAPDVSVVGGMPALPWKLGAAGVFSEKKGTHLFADLVDRLPAGDYRLYYIGRVSGEWKAKFDARRDKFTFVENPSDEVFASQFQQLDFVLFFYPRHTYRFGLSGVFIEAIKYSKPVIAIRNRMFDYYFEKYGRLGWLFDDYDSLVRFVQGASRTVTDEDLRAFSSNYQALRREFSPEATLRQLSAIVDE